MSENSHARKFSRFELLHRVEHVVMLVSFTILALTGIPQKFPEGSVSLWMMQTLGGVENTRSIHHVSAIVLIVVSIFHFTYIGYKLYVLRRRPGMLPTLKDIRDFVQLVSYNVGIATARPKMEYYNFGEKIEYWAVVWGTLIMAMTGYMLWNPVVITKFLPGEFIPAAKAAHGAEAILAALSILTWHVYHVHLKYFNRSIFTGKMSYHEMEEEHGAVLERTVPGWKIGLRRRQTCSGSAPAPTCPSPASSWFSSCWPPIVSSPSKTRPSPPCRRRPTRASTSPTIRPDCQQRRPLPPA